MTTKYVALSAAIVIDSDNDNFTVTIGGVTEVVSVAQGTYYLLGPLTDPSVIWKGFKDAIESHSSSPTVTLGAMTVRNINGTTALTYEMEWTTSTSLSLSFIGGSNNFPYSRLGMPASYAAATSFSNTVDPQGFWVADQPAASEEKAISTRDITQNDTLDGDAFTYQRGLPINSIFFSFDFISPERTIMAERNSLLSAASARYRTFQNFLYYAVGNGIRCSKLDETAVPTTLSGQDTGASIVSSQTYFGVTAGAFNDWIISEETKSVF